MACPAVPSITLASVPRLVPISASAAAVHCLPRATRRLRTSRRVRVRLRPVGKAGIQPAQRAHQRLLLGIEMLEGPYVALARAAAEVVFAPSGLALHRATPRWRATCPGPPRPASSPSSGTSFG
jgi:hypothetical protein